MKIFFVLRSSMYSCLFFLISFASVRSIPLLSYIVLLFAWNIFLVSLIFLKWSLVSPILFFPLFLCQGRLFFLIVEESFLISPCYCMELCIWMGISFFFSFDFSLLFFTQLFVRPSQTTILCFCTSFSWVSSWSLPSVQCHEPPCILL